MNISLPLPFSNIALILGNLRHGVAAWGGRGLLDQVLLHLLYRRLGEIDRAITRLAARFLAGRLWRIEGRVAAVRGDAAAVGGRRAAPAASVWPRQFGWLMVKIGWQAGGFGGQLQHVLEQPEMVALLGASPQAARLLGPVFHMLGMSPRVLRPLPEGVVAEVAVLKVSKTRIRKPRVPIDWGRIPLPRGVLTAARKAGFETPH